MSIKNVVKVMNFHSLLRVDRSRAKAKKYLAMEKTLTDMIDNIVNNRNIVLDYKTLRPDEKKPELAIYLGSDMGFCGNLNSLVNRSMEGAAREERKILIGRKIHALRGENVLLSMTRQEYEADNSAVMELLAAGIREMSYSRICIVYNHYYNSSQVELRKKQIFPMEYGKEEKKRKSGYNEDFVCESDINRLLEDMMILYMQYSLEIASATSSAAENITRQNVTTESLKKIDEREELQTMELRKEEKQKQFARVLDNYTKLKHY